MQKLNLLNIVLEHIGTLRKDGASRISALDIFTFYGIPASASIAAYYYCFYLDNGAISLTVTVFSIFAALLLSVQVALYSVSSREMKAPDDPKKLSHHNKQMGERKKLLKEVNINISYLLLLSVIFLTLAILFYVFSFPKRMEASAVSFLYLHFFMTLLMVVKRASIVFSKEYD